MLSPREQEIISYKLDDTLTEKLESSIPQKARELLEYLRTRRKITLYDRTKNPMQDLVPAFTLNYDDHSEIWLTPNNEWVLDTFIHEIGQVYSFILGYKNGSHRYSSNAHQNQLNQTLVRFAMNAFITEITESNLEKYGLDRTFYKETMARNFGKFLEANVSAARPDYNKWQTPFHRAELCFLYVGNRLRSGDDFSKLELLWQERVRFPNIRKGAKIIYAEALKKEMTPARYAYLQRFFLKTLDLHFAIP